MNTSETKSIKAIKAVITILVCLLAGCVFTALSAVLPRMPYSVTAQEELSELTFGFPLKFVAQYPDETEISALTEKGFNTSFILPRYDKYNTTIDVGYMLLNVLIMSVATAAALGMVTVFPQLTKRISVFVLIGLIICILSAILPAPPGTFQTIEDLQPMRFGVPLKFIEQTPSINTLMTVDTNDLNQALSGSYWAPKIFFGNISNYTTHIRGWLLVASVFLNALISAAVYNVFILFKAIHRRAVFAKYKECVQRLILNPLQKFLQPLLTNENP